MENDLKIFIVIRLQQEIILYGEIFSPTRLLFQYTKALSKSYKLKASIAPNELLIKTKLKGDTVMDLKNFYRHIKMYINICLNAVNRPQEDLLLEYQYIKIHS